MSDETFAQATMRKIRELEAENKRKDLQIASLRQRVKDLEAGREPWDRVRWPRSRYTWRCEAAK